MTTTEHHARGRTGRRMDRAPLFVAAALAEELRRGGSTVVLFDSNQQACRRAREAGPDESLLFVHTGGTPAVFAYGSAAKGDNPAAPVTSMRIGFLAYFPYRKLL